MNIVKPDVLTTIQLSSSVVCTKQKGDLLIWTTVCKLRKTTEELSNRLALLLKILANEVCDCSSTYSTYCVGYMVISQRQCIHVLSPAPSIE